MGVGMRNKFVLATCICILGLFPCLAWSGDYTFTKIVDDNTVRPDGNGNFSIWWPFPPSLDGKTVLIQDYNPNLCAGVDSLWTSPITGKSYNSLVEIGQPAPGGTGNFTDLAAPIGATASNGIVVFQSDDEAGAGVYTIPITGGTPDPVITHNQNFPDGAAFYVNFGTCEYTMNGVSTDGQHVAINPGAGRLLVSPVKKSSITESVATFNVSQWPLSPRVPVGIPLILEIDTCSFVDEDAPTYATLALSGRDIVFTGGSAWGAEYNQVLYRTELEGFPNGPYDCNGTELNPPMLANYATQLPGDTQQPNDSFSGAVAADDGGRGAPNKVAYVIENANGNYECLVLQDADGKKFSAVACNNALLPGLTTLPITFESISMDGGMLAFVAEDAASNVGLYAYDGQKIRKVIASGDPLNGGTVGANWQQPDLTISPRALSSGKIAFFALTTSDIGDYVARVSK